MRSNARPPAASDVPGEFRRIRALAEPRPADDDERPAPHFLRTPRADRRRVVEKLPPTAAAKLARLEAAADDLQAAILALSERRTAARLHVQELRQVLRRAEEIVGHTRRGTAGPGWAEGGEPNGLVVTRRDLADAEAEFAALNDRYNGLLARRSPIATRCREWLAQQRGALVMIEPVEIETAAGADLVALVEEARQERLRLLADRRAVRDAPITGAEAKAALTAQVDRLAERGRPDILGVAEQGGQLGFRMLPGDFTGIPDSISLIAWACRDQLLAKLSAELDDVIDDAAALGAEERAERLAEIAAQLADAERREEGLIELAGVRGITIPRRPDADPAAVLGVVVAEAA